MVYYFAYGSNLSAEQMKRRCPGSEIVDVGYIDDHEIGFTTYSGRWGGGVADVIEKNGTRVYGAIYLLSDRNLNSLDGFEGYPTYYDRKLITVVGNERLYEKVWVYFVVDKKGHIPPTREYYGIMLDASDEFGFPVDHRERLQDIIEQKRS